MKTGSINRNFVSIAWAIGCTLSTPTLLPAQSYSESWPQWRGPTRDGKVTGDRWPDRLQGDHLRLLWRKELPPSFSGPIVVGDRVFVTETKDKKVEVVRALDRKTGSEIWKAQWEGAMEVLPIGKSMGSWIRATPAHDGKSLYVSGMRDVLVCLNADRMESTSNSPPSTTPAPSNICASTFAALVTPTGRPLHATTNRPKPFIPIEGLN